MVLVHAALKWFHSFVPYDGPNPLDNACCQSLIECAKRTRSNPVNKKKPPDPAIIRSIIDRHGAEEASLKEFPSAAISSLGFAGFFRFNELANIQPKHLTFCYGFVKIFVLRSKTERENLFTSLSQRTNTAQQLSYVGILKQPIWICLVTCLYSGHKRKTSRVIVLQGNI